MLCIQWHYWRVLIWWDTAIYIFLPTFSDPYSPDVLVTLTNPNPVRLNDAWNVVELLHSLVEYLITAQVCSVLLTVHSEDDRYSPQILEHYILPTRFSLHSKIMFELGIFFLKCCCKLIFGSFSSVLKKMFSTATFSVQNQNVLFYAIYQNCWKSISQFLNFLCQLF